MLFKDMIYVYSEYHTKDINVKIRGTHKSHSALKIRNHAICYFLEGTKLFLSQNCVKVFLIINHRVFITFLILQTVKN